MPEYEKTSEQTAASAITTADKFVGVQSSETVLYTGTQVGAFVAGDATSLTTIAAAVAVDSSLTTAFQALSAGITNTVQITGEYQLTEDNELDYSGSMGDGTTGGVTFSELPAATVAIHVQLKIRDASTNPTFQWKRASAATTVFDVSGLFADAGANLVRGTYWMPTGGNAIVKGYINSDTEMVFKIIGYKTGA